MFSKKSEEGSDSSKEWALLEKVAMASALEQKRSRRWSMIRFFIIVLLALAYLGFIQTMAGSNAGSSVGQSTEPHTAVVRINGIIMDEQEASAGAINQGLRDAFEAESSKAIVLAVNSPGGSPVHAGYVYDEIVRLKALYPDKKVYAVISDLGASAAYYIAAAADEIYADKASLVGSIGVISASFGFDQAMEKIGVERRVITAGENKAFLDPYQPWKDSEKAFWEQSLGVIHKQFIEQVQKGRGDKLIVTDETFSGYIWTGEQALENGLIDGLGSVRFVAREVAGHEELVDYTVSAHPLDQIFKRLGLGMAQAFYQQMSSSSYVQKPMMIMQ